MSIGKIAYCPGLIFFLVLLVVFLAVPPIVSAQDENLDEFKVRISGFWLRSSPSVTLEAAGHNGFVDFNRDFGFFAEGNLYGMYLFGYGNYISTANVLGLSLSKHLSVKAGYALGSRLRVNTTTNRVGLNLTQQGPLVGGEVSF